MSLRYPGAIVRTFGDLSPRIDPSAWIAPGATVVGDVEIGADSSVFYGSVLRGDVHHIRIGARTNIQDQANLHVTEGRFPTLLGDDITVGHGAVVHGCSVASGALIGIGSVILDGAQIGENALVAAGAVVVAVDAAVVIATGAAVVAGPPESSPPPPHPTRNTTATEIRIFRIPK